MASSVRSMRGCCVASVCHLVWSEASLVTYTAWLWTAGSKAQVGRPGPCDWESASRTPRGVLTSRPSSARPASCCLCTDPTEELASIVKIDLKRSEIGMVLTLPHSRRYFFKAFSGSSRQRVYCILPKFICKRDSNVCLALLSSRNHCRLIFMPRESILRRRGQLSSRP